MVADGDRLALIKPFSGRSVVDRVCIIRANLVQRGKHAIVANRHRRAFDRRNKTVLSNRQTPANPNNRIEAHSDFSVEAASVPNKDLSPRTVEMDGAREFYVLTNYQRSIHICEAYPSILAGAA